MTEQVSENAWNSCSNCRFWDRFREDDVSVGHCKRNAPVRSEKGRWPYTYEDEWCGEHQEAVDG